MNLEDNLIKKILSISFDDFIQNRIGSLKSIKWEDRYIKGRDPHPVPRHCEKKNKKPITGMLLLGDDKRSIESKSILFKGIHLGPELFANSFRTLFLNKTYGLDINLNWSACSEDNLKKLIGQNPRIPYSIRLFYFGAEISDWYPKPHASKFSIKFYDKFIKQSLTQDKLIKEIEKSIGIYKSRNYGFQREIVHILKSINNFETFLNDEMNLLKEKFKDFKKIETIADCANLLFIFNPLFKDVMEFEFKNFYIEHDAEKYKKRYPHVDYEANAKEYKKKFKLQFNKIKKQKDLEKQKFEDRIEQTKFDF